MVLLSKDKTHASLIQQAMIIPLCHKRKASPTPKTKNWRKKKKSIYMLAFYMQKGNELMLANLDVYASLLLSLIFFFFFLEKTRSFFSCLDVIIIFIFPFSPLNMSTLTFCFYSFYKIYLLIFIYVIHHLLSMLLSLSPPPHFPHLNVVTITSTIIQRRCRYHHYHQ